MKWFIEGPFYRFNNLRGWGGYVGWRKVREHEYLQPYSCPGAQSDVGMPDHVAGKRVPKDIRKQIASLCTRADPQSNRQESFFGLGAVGRPGRAQWRIEGPQPFDRSGTNALQRWGYGVGWVVNKSYARAFRCWKNGTADLLSTATVSGAHVPKAVHKKAEKACKEWAAALRERNQSSFFGRSR